MVNDFVGIKKGPHSVHVSGKEHSNLIYDLTSDENKTVWVCVINCTYFIFLSSHIHTKHS